jgi:DNA-directed RNA polymerase subunit omega
VHTNRKQYRGDISRPPVDELTQVAGGQFQLVNAVAKRARQLTAFHAGLGEGLLEYVGPLVVPRASEKPLSTALREVHEGLIEFSTPGAL